MINERLTSLRKAMKTHHLDAYLIPGTDPHQSEYLPQMWKRREWISGFTGSAGNVAITLDKCGLWTDSRYFIQAENELSGSEIILFKQGLKDTPTMAQWLITELAEGSKVGIDPQLFSIFQATEMEQKLKEKKIILLSVEKNLVDTVRNDQSPLPKSQLKIHPEIYSGESTESKLARLRKAMKDNGADFHVIPTLDSIAWLFNIRGNDVDYNPLVIAYAVISQKQAWLFTSLERINSEVKNTLNKTIELKEYSDFKPSLLQICQQGTKVWLDGNRTSKWIAGLLSDKCNLLYLDSPIIMMKAIKNPTEISGMRNAHIRDGAALVQFLYWLEHQLGQETITELSAQYKLEEFRKKQNLFQGPSFNTISSFGPHGAINHYASSETTNIELTGNNLYLLDSGGHYLDGTTDITRTIAIGQPTAEHKDRYTRVLKGHVQLSMAIYPAGTKGCQLDILARQALWNGGLNYGHNTGHGVGAYLCVHEGPQSLSHTRNLLVPLEEGMITSNEPGFYKENDYGIRIENLILTTKNNKLSTENQVFYHFETLSFCPYDIRLIEPTLLSPEEKDFINQYHKEVRTKLKPLLSNKEYQWLEKMTPPIDIE
ncbi:MAG: aminopeptidase P family protein [Spirochaetes bacterium]|nr:aminopeptidase P family protein [Spirochaetota bacterium]